MRLPPAATGGKIAARNAHPTWRDCGFEPYRTHQSGVIELAASVAAIVIAVEKRIVAAFRQAGATSASNAVSTGEIGVHQRVAFRKLLEHGVLRESGNRRFYLDEGKWENLRSLRHRLVFGILLLVGVAFLAALAYFTLYR